MLPKALKVAQSAKNCQIGSHCYLLHSTNPQILKAYSGLVTSLLAHFKIQNVFIFQRFLSCSRHFSEQIWPHLSNFSINFVILIWKKLKLIKFWLWFLSQLNFWIRSSVTSKKLPNVYKNCPKMISLDKLNILTPLQKLPKNVGNLGKLIAAKGFEKLPKVQ